MATSKSCRADYEWCFKCDLEFIYLIAVEWNSLHTPVSLFDIDSISDPFQWIEINLPDRFYAPVVDLSYPISERNRMDLLRDRTVDNDLVIPNQLFFEDWGIPCQLNLTREICLYFKSVGPSYSFPIIFPSCVIPCNEVTPVLSGSSQTSIGLYHYHCIYSSDNTIYRINSILRAVLQLELHRSAYL